MGEERFTIYICIYMFSFVFFFRDEKKHVKFKVDRTKDGVFIGDQQLSLELRDSVF